MKILFILKTRIPCFIKFILFYFSVRTQDEIYTLSKVLGVQTVLLTTGTMLCSRPPALPLHFIKTYCPLLRSAHSPPSPTQALAAPLHSDSMNRTTLSHTRRTAQYLSFHGQEYFQQGGAGGGAETAWGMKPRYRAQHKFDLCHPSTSCWYDITNEKAKPFPFAGNQSGASRLEFPKRAENFERVGEGYCKIDIVIQDIKVSCLAT